METNIPPKDQRYCTIISVEPILKNPKKELSDENPVKAYKLEIEVEGESNRTVVSAIADLFKPIDLLGVKTLFQMDLPPMKIRGFESQAMIVLKEPEETLITYL